MKMFSEAQPMLKIKFDATFFKGLNINSKESLAFKVKNDKIVVHNGQRRLGVIKTQTSQPVNVIINLAGSSIKEFCSLADGDVEFYVQPFYNLKRSFLVNSQSGRFLIEGTLEKAVR